MGSPPRLFRRAPSHQRFQPRQQFGERKRLHQIIVAAGLQARHPVVDLAKRAQEQDRRVDTRLAQPPDHGQTVAARQHPIDDQRVIRPAAGHGMTVIPIRRMIDRVAALLQSLDQVARRLLVVFEQQDLHGANVIVRPDPANLRDNGDPRVPCGGRKSSTRGQGPERPNPGPDRGGRHAARVPARPRRAARRPLP